MSNIADLALNAGTGKWEAIYRGRVLASSPARDYVEKVISGGFSKKAKAMGVTGVRVVGEAQVLANGEVVAATEIATIEKEFGINERFSIVADYADMVASGSTASALVTGEGGLGKSYTVMQVVKARGLRDISKAPVGTKFSPMTGFVVVKGFSTAKGLFRTLHDHKKQVIIFDDCDAVLRDPTSVNILKAALDSYDVRTVTWNSEGGFGDDDLPKTFEFEGGVIFISNMSKDKVPQAIRSRALCADVSMSRAEVVERMRVIASSKDFMPDIDRAIKDEALEFVAEHAFHPLVKSLNLRSLLSVIKIRTAKPDTWRRTALYDMANT